MTANIATDDTILPSETPCEEGKLLGLIWDAVFYTLAIPMIIVIFVGRYWVGRFYPFDARVWTNEFLCFLMFLPLVVIYSFSLLIRERIRRLIVHLVILGLLVALFEKLPLGYQAFTYGFREYFTNRACVSQIHTWLKDLDPELRKNKYYLFYKEDKIEMAPQTDIRFPEAILALKPVWLTLDTDSMGHPKVKLEWGMGPDLIYGIEIGCETMTIPKTRERVDYPFTPGEFRLPLNSYSYVLCSIN
jgi:hypothetical protein